MVERTYGDTTRISNSFGLHNAFWFQILNETYSATRDTTPTRRELFHKIQEDFATEYFPSFYLLQLGTEIGFNREYVDEDSIVDLLNLFCDLFWFNIRFTPPEDPLPWVAFVLGRIVVGVTLTVYFTLRWANKEMPKQRI